MTGAETVAIAAGSFVATHFILSHPLRRPLIGVVGENGFMVVYSIVAFATLGATIWAYRAAPATAPYWPVGDGMWAIATVVMLAASVLLMGSLVGNPALPGAGAAAATATPRGVYAITRHPMMWSFALWGVCHVLVFPIAKNVAVSVAIVVLALVGAAMQDAKKAALDPAGWPLWQSRTSYLPFGAIARGRARLGGFGGHAIGGGLVVWLAATWAHLPLAGWPAGIWKWIV